MKTYVFNGSPGLVGLIYIFQIRSPQWWKVHSTKKRNAEFQQNNNIPVPPANRPPLLETLIFSGAMLGFGRETKKNKERETVQNPSAFFSIITLLVFSLLGIFTYWVQKTKYPSKKIGKECFGCMGENDPTNPLEPIQTRSGVCLYFILVLAKEIH